MTVSAKTRRLLARRRGVLLDISLGGTPQEGAVTLGPTGDIAHDPRRVPFPLPTGSVHTAVVTHVLEYLAPGAWFPWWDELHRVLRPGGIVYVSGPYGGDESEGWLSDPSHQTRVIEQSVAWLDPRTPFYQINTTLGRSLPHPWHALELKRIPSSHGTIGYNFVLKSQKAA